MSTQIQLTRRALRNVLVLAIAATSVFGFISTATANATSNTQFNSAASLSAEFDYITVSAGQTLWGLAEELAPNSNPQDWMQNVVNLNGLTSTDLVPGQRIALP